MNVLYLCPHFPPAFSKFCIGLANAGINVLGVGEEPMEQMTDELRNALTDYRQVSNLEDYEQVYRTAGQFIANHGRIDRVESHNEYWMMHEAQLREDFNIQGPDVAETIMIKKKSEMKKMFKNTKSPVVDGEIVESKESLKKFIKKHGYPVFTKPDIGVGAMSTYKLDDDKAVENFWETKPEGDYFVEPYIDGVLMTVDGIADQDGEIVFYSSLRSVVSAYDLVSKNADLSYYLVRDIPEDALKIANVVVKEFGITAKFFHLEFLRRKSDEKLFVLEMNCRPPGGFTVDLMNYSANVNVYQEWANIVATNKFYGEIDRKYFAAHISRKEGKNYKHSDEEIYARYADKIAAHLEVPSVFAEVMGNVAFLCRSTEEQDVFDMASFIQETY